MSENELNRLKAKPGVAVWRLQLGDRVESVPAQILVTAVILLNAIILGLDTSASARASMGPLISTIDKLCLVFFVIELLDVPRRGFQWEPDHAVIRGVSRGRGSSAWKGFICRWDAGGAL